VKAAYLGG